MRPLSRLYLFWIKGYLQKTVGDLRWPQMTFGGLPMKTVAWIITKDLSQHHSQWMEMFWCEKEVFEILPIDLTRALLGGGGGRLNAPLRFFEDSEKTAARSAAGFSPTLPPHLFPNFCENLGPRPCEVRSPGQVKWPNYKITFPSRHGYNVSGKVMKLLEYDEVISAYKTYILDFWYRWPQVRSFLRPPHYKSMGKKSTLLYLLWRKRFWVESYRIGQLWTIRVKNCITYPSKGHLRSPEVTNRNLPITFDQKEIETWDWCQYARLGQANRVIYNMTHFGHHVTLAWLDLRSNFDLDLSKSFYIWFDAP